MFKINTLTEKGIVSEMICDSNFAYILENNSHFLSTEYKVLQNQTSSCFVRCMKMLYNGKIQLYYLTGEYKSLASLLYSLDDERFYTIITNILSDIIEVKNNGFLSCQNIDISFEHIFVDMSTYKVSLIYLPISQRIYDDYSIFENELRTGFIKLISELKALSSPKVLQLSSYLSNGSLSLENLYYCLKDSNSGMPRRKLSHARLVSLNAPERIELKVEKDEFIIGKKVGKVDGVISFNDKISRVHCKINRNGAQYTITDLHSANGTYINKIKLQPNMPSPIKNGDVIRLANSDFQLVIG